MIINIKQSTGVKEIQKMNTTQPDQSVENDYQESNFLARRFEDITEAAFQAQKACKEGADVARKHTITINGETRLIW